MAVILVYVLSCALAGLVAGKGVGRQRFFCGLLAGLLYFLVLMAVSFLLEKGIISKCEYGVKILGNGELTKKLTVRASAFSASAKEKIEKAGGTAEVI